LGHHRIATLQYIANYPPLQRTLTVYAFYSEYGDFTEDVAIFLETLSFKLKGFFILKR